MTPLERSRKLRREMSPAEIALWLELRKRPHGFKFRRQRPSDPATLDFFCFKAGLAIEVDGDAHDFEARACKDEARDKMMLARGIKTIRVPVSEVFRNLQGVLQYIVEECASRTPSTASRSPSPRKRGEEWSVSPASSPRRPEPGEAGGP